MTRFPLLVALVAVSLIGIAGCRRSQSTSVHGNVTVNGQPISKGYITFFPVAGTESTLGGDITNGAFKVTLTPGQKRAYITITPEATVADNGQGKTLQFNRGQLFVHAQTPGNNQLVEIRSGAQEMNFALTTP